MKFKEKYNRLEVNLYFWQSLIMLLACAFLLNQSKQIYELLGFCMILFYFFKHLFYLIKNTIQIVKLGGGLL